MAYGRVEIVGGWENLLTKDNAKDGNMLPQTQNLMFMFKMIHCNGNGQMMAKVLILSLIVLIYVFE